MSDGVEFFGEQVVAVDAEVGGDEAEGVGAVKVFLQVAANLSGSIVQNAPLFAGFFVHGLATMDRFAPKSGTSRKSPRRRIGFLTVFRESSVGVRFDV